MTDSSNTLDVVYRDESLLVVNKPAGLLAVPGRGQDKQDCLSARLQSVFPDALVVHRLDMATSGLMVFARGIGMQRRLSRMFQEREVEKRYVAVVAGKLEPETGEVDLPIAADWPKRPLQKIDAALGKHSLTRYRLLSTENSVRPDLVEGWSRQSGADFDGVSPNGSSSVSRVELEPITGRTHQLRVHMAAIGHSILGDALYGNAASASRLLLHASSLSFAHPVSGEPLKFASSPPF